MTIAVATYRACPYGEAVQVQSVEMPADRLTPAVASYLRFGGRITDRVLDQFTWEGAVYGPMGDHFSP